MEEDSNIPLILGSFLAIGRVLIGVYDGKMILQMDNDQVIFNVFKVMKHPLTSDTCCQVHVMEELVADTFNAKYPAMIWETKIAKSKKTSAKRTECLVHLAEQPNGRRRWQYEFLGENLSPPVGSNS